MKMVQWAALVALVVFEAGCGVSEPEGVHIVSTESPPFVFVGDSAVLTMTVANHFFQRIAIGYSAREPYEVTVKRGDSLYVWTRFNYVRSGVDFANQTIDPDEVITYRVVWHLVDNDGEPVVPGTYHWIGQLGANLFAPPHKLEVRAKP